MVATSCRSMASKQKKPESPPAAPAAPAAAASAASAEPAEPAEPSDLMKAYMWSPPLLIAHRSVFRRRAALMPPAWRPRLLERAHFLRFWLRHALGANHCATQGSGSGAAVRPG